MFFFPASQDHRSEFVIVEAQRKPNSYMGLERMLLHWVALMAFVTLSSLSLVSIPGTASRVLQVIWVPFAALGVVYSIWKYFSRLNSLVFLGRTIESRVGSDPLAYAGLVGLFIAVVISVLVLTILNNGLL